METTAKKDCCQGCRDCSATARYVCRCLRITEETVVAAITTLGLRSIKELKVVTGAGDGCTCCHQELKQLIDRFAPAAPYAVQPSSSPEPICS